MATYIVGDIQGCFSELQALLEQVDFDPQRDHLWLAGDLVARGKQSLETLRFVRNLGEHAHIVLGNHDLHLLAVASGVKPVKASDHTQAILDAPDRDELLHWLRHQPLLAEHEEFVMAHAGISPLWDLDTARQCAREVEDQLRSDKWLSLIQKMYDNAPDQWSPTLTGIERWRYTINAYTRMRFCTRDGRLDMACKLPPRKVTDPNLMPWFDLPQRIALPKTVIFGHWAALEGHQSDKVIGLDTGCVWGNCLTMLRWEDQHYFQQAALQPQSA